MDLRQEGIHNHMSPRITNWTRIRTFKFSVNGRRVNKEKRRHDLAIGCFVSLPRLVLQNGKRKVSLV